MKLKKSSFLLLLLALSSCSTKSAFNYSQDVVTTERLLAPQIQETETKVQVYFAAQKFDSMAIVSRKMETAVQNAMERLDAIPVPDVKEADAFKTGFMKYFRFMKSVYTGYRNVAEATTEEARNKYLLEAQQIPTKRTAILSEIRAVQKKFADANGFKIQ